jgi:hypothetical protein
MDMNNLPDYESVLGRNGGPESRRPRPVLGCRPSMMMTNQYFLAFTQSLLT